MVYEFSLFFYNLYPNFWLNVPAQIIQPNAFLIQRYGPDEGELDGTNGVLQLYFTLPGVAAAFATRLFTGTPTLSFQLWQKLNADDEARGRAQNLIYAWQRGFGRASSDDTGGGAKVGGVPINLLLNTHTAGLRYMGRGAARNTWIDGLAFPYIDPFVPIVLLVGGVFVLVTLSIAFPQHTTRSICSLCYKQGRNWCSDLEEHAPYVEEIPYL